ncbi:site-specific integrase, partial [Parabacteroides distasonis]
WNAAHSDIVIPPSAAPQRHGYLQSLRDTLETDRKKLLSVIARLEKEAQPYTSDKVVEYYREGKVLQGFFAYTAELSNRLHSIGKTRMADRYTTTVNSLRRYLNGNDIP